MSEEIEIRTLGFSKYIPSPITCLCIDKSRTKIALFRSNNILEIWNCLHLPFREQCFRTRGVIECATWCSERLFSGALTGALVEHMIGGRYGEEARHSTAGGCYAIRANHQQTMLAVGTKGGYITLYSCAEGGFEYLKVLHSTDQRVLGLSWAPRGDLIAAIAEDKIFMCSLGAGQSVTSIQGIMDTRRQRGVAVLLAVLVLEDLTVVTGDKRGTVSFWNGQTNTMINAVGALKEAVLTIACDADSKYVFVSGVDSIVAQLNRDCNGKWFKAHIAELHSHDTKALVVDHQMRVFSGGVDTHLGVHYFQGRPPKVCLRLPPRPPLGWLGLSGGSALLCSEDAIDWWRLGKNNAGQQTRSLLTRIVSSVRGIACAALSPQGWAAAWAVRGKAWRVCRVDRGKDSSMSLSPLEVLGAEDEPRHLLWLAEDHLLVVTERLDLQVWKVGDTKVVFSHALPCEGDCLGPLAVEGKYLLAGGSKGSTLYDWEMGCIAASLPPTSAPITAVALRTPSLPPPSNSPKAKRRKLANGHATEPEEVLALLCCSDNSVTEYEAISGALTRFGELMARGSGRVGGRTAISGASWTPRGKDGQSQRLCLHTDEEVLLVDEEVVLNTNWAAVVGQKSFTDRVGRSQVMNADGTVTDVSKTAKGFVYHKKRSRRTRVDTEAEKWKEVIVKHTTNSDSFLFNAKFVGENEVFSVQLKHDDLLEHLPDPFFVPKFGTA